MAIKIAVTITAFCSAALASGCATTANGPPVIGDGACDADAVQHLLGETVSQQLGASAVTAAGARTLRWIPEGSPVTMDYRADRLNIEYDAESEIISIRCG